MTVMTSPKIWTFEHGKWVLSEVNLPKDDRQPKSQDDQYVVLSDQKAEMPDPILAAPEPRGVAHKVVPGCGAEMIYDFDPAQDILDVSAFGANVQTTLANLADLGWGTQLNLFELPYGAKNDRLILSSVSPENLVKENFEV